MENSDPNYAGIPKPYQSPSAPHTQVEPLAHVTITPPQDGKKGVPLPLFMAVLVITFIAGLLLASFYFQKQPGPPPEVRTVVSAPKTLIVGVDATAFPMEYGTKEGGVAGYDIDLAYRIANEIGATVEFKNLERGSLLAELKDKKIDMIISSLAITDEDKNTYTFSKPYLSTGQVIISQTSTPITTPEALKDKTIAVQKNTTGEKEAANYTSAELITAYDSRAEAVQALADGEVDALIVDQTLAKEAISTFAALSITSEPFTHESYGVVLRKDQTELVFKVDKALKTLEEQGILDDLKSKWLE